MLDRQERGCETPTVRAQTCFLEHAPSTFGVAVVRHRLLVRPWLFDGPVSLALGRIRGRRGEPATLALGSLASWFWPTIFFARLEYRDLRDPVLR